MTGKFITLEGGEGAGKSTQLTLLAAALTAAGLEVVATREPGGTEGAEAIRALLVNGEPGRWNGITEVLLVNAARADHVARLIRPALTRGAWVICDRFVDSTIAYQGAGKGIARDVLLEQHRLATGNLWPDITFFLEVPEETGSARAGARDGAGVSASEPSRFEAHDDAFHHRVARSFAHAAAADPARIRRIDGELAIDAVAAAIWAEVAPLLAGRC